MTEPARQPPPAGHGTVYGSASAHNFEYSPESSSEHRSERGADTEHSGQSRPVAPIEHSGQQSWPTVPPHSIPYEVQAYPMPSQPPRSYPAQSYPAQVFPAQVFPAHVLPAQVHPTRAFPDVYPPQPTDDMPWPLVAGEPPVPPRRRVALAVGIALAVLVLLGGAGTAAYFLVGPAKARGAAQPSAAVEGFLGAVYTTHSAKDAAAFVCPRARNNAELDQIVFTVKTFEKDYASPRTTWTYPQIQPVGRQASAAVTLTLTTAHEQVSQKTITLLLVNERGWWVCDVDETPS